MPKHESMKRQYFLSAEDKAWMKQRMTERKMGVAQLAKAVGMSRQNVYLMLGAARHTWDWDVVVSVLGGTPPGGTPVALDDRLAELVRRWPELSEADRSMIENLARRLVGKKP